MVLPKTCKCYLVTKDPRGNVAAEITRRPLDELPCLREPDL